MSRTVDFFEQTVTTSTHWDAEEWGAEEFDWDLSGTFHPEIRPSYWDDEAGDAAEILTFRAEMDFTVRGVRLALRTTNQDFVEWLMDLDRNALDAELDLN